MSESPLNSSWTLYYHTFDSIDWTIAGYQRLGVITSIEDFLTITGTIKDWNIGLFYLMRDPRPPVWEDPLNKGSGTWTDKIPKTNASTQFINICKLCLGETALLPTSKLDRDEVIGVSISPKNTFSTIKIWTKSNKSRVTDFIQFPDPSSRAYQSQAQREFTFNISTFRFAINK